MSGSIADKGKKIFQSQNYHKIKALFGTQISKVNKQDYFLKVLANSHSNHPKAKQKREDYAKSFGLQESDFIKLQDKLNLKLNYNNGVESVIFHSVDFPTNTDYTKVIQLLEKNNDIRNEKIDAIKKFVEENNIDVIIPNFLKKPILFEIIHDYTHTEVDTEKIHSYNNKEKIMINNKKNK